MGPELSKAFWGGRVGEMVFEFDHIYSFVIFMSGPGKKFRKLKRIQVIDK